MSDSETNDTIPITLIENILVDEEANTEQKVDHLEEKNIPVSTQLLSPTFPNPSQNNNNISTFPRPLRTTKIHKDNYKAKTEEKNITDHAMYPTPEWVYDIKYMTFSGGGVKGYAYTGAILTLDDAFRRKGKNLYKQLKGVSGTSIGAMYALFITLGVRGQQLIKDVLHTDILHITQNIAIDNLIDMYGLNSSLKFRQQVFDILEKHAGKGDITFKELYSLTRIHYVCCVTNVTLGQVEYHSYLTTPNFKVFESVTASMSIPLLFVPSIINGHYYVDGGLTDNCPFSVFPPDENFMIYLTGNLPDLSSLQNYTLRLAMLNLRATDKAQFRLLQPEQQKRRLHMNIKEISSLDFNVSIDMKKQLLIRGAKHMEKFLNPNSILNDYIKILTKALCYKIIEDQNITTTITKNNNNNNKNIIPQQQQASTITSTTTFTAPSTINFIDETEKKVIN